MTTNGMNRKRVDDLTEWIRNSMQVSFARSSGAGGQNVNKVNTKVIASLPLSGTDVLSQEEREVLYEKLGNRINTEGQLVIHSQEGRTQLRNREIAEERMIHLVLGALTPQKQRKRTRPGRAAKENRLRQKHMRSDVKKARGKPGIPD